MSLIKYVNNDFIKKIIEKGVSKCTINTNSKEYLIKICIDKNEDDTKVLLLKEYILNENKDYSIIREYIIKINKNKIIISTLNKDKIIYERIYNYDDNGNKLSVIINDKLNNNFQSISNYNYDNKGKLLLLTTSENDKIVGNIIYHYFEMNGHLCCLGSNGFFEEYNKNNQLICERKLYAHKNINVNYNLGIEYEYDNNDNIIRKLKTVRFINSELETNGYKIEYNISYNEYNLPISTVIKNLQDDKKCEDTIKYDYEY